MTFWGARWARADAPSGGGASLLFKGYANNLSVPSPVCGVPRTSDPRNSSHPAATVSAYVGVLVSSWDTDTL